MTLWQFAGEKAFCGRSRSSPTLSAPPFPAATTTIEPAAVAALMASCSLVEHAPSPPRLRLITRAGVGFNEMPSTGKPAAQRIALISSLVSPPHAPRIRMCCIWDCRLIPAMPKPLLVFAPMIPATFVPCHESGMAPQASPGSVASASLPKKSYPGSGVGKSGWTVYPVSMTATTIEGEPVVWLHAASIPIPLSVVAKSLRYHWFGYSASLGAVTA